MQYVKIHDCANIDFSLKSVMILFSLFKASPLSVLSVEIRQKAEVLSQNTEESGCCIRDGSFEPKVDQIGFKWDKSGNFSDQIYVYFGSPS